MFLLDTNVVSELRKISDGRVAPGVAAWFATVDPADCYVSPITLMEIETGILRIARRDILQGNRLRIWMETDVRPQFSVRTLPIDSDVAFQCAQLHCPDPRPDRDAWIAATALVHDMTVVTRNVADFSPMGVRLLNPWTALSGHSTP
ncbi:type II toxin-antitoxin system VapC family toxin [Tardiphaga alba]|uniref:Type II toxin-antitoxin system VapC family toxin n=1 Tax=Tardiphaga alba TaxID=340268 RepID=A0ABX8AAB6_9BRAD|nr:type II toxin-antitoxin system VapC family toxin [Tardiphaga alba]QUS39363.1 type II toxin-antitoxin system VapC family toxin [Tardiphaga alba]